ncbi:MAG TPA: methyltransferase domain-containing protein [Acidimicrobiia bacterium]|nr:methyltransferase domain-containing protein [Acidimicrobiia bacterium]
MTEQYANAGDTKSDADRGRVAATAAEVYEAFFLPALFAQWAGQVLDAAYVSPGDHLLDVGCGTGVVAREALARVGHGGRVVGVDPNEGMLAVAQRTPRVEWRTGVAEDLPFADASFDAVVSQFAMMFFDDRERAVREMERVLRPGGRVAIATWASLTDTPGYAAVVDLLDRLLGKEAGDALRAPYNMGDTSELERLMSPVFVDVAVTQHEGTARFDSIESWVHTDIRGWTLSDISDEDYERLMTAAEDELASFTDDAGKVTFPAPALIATASVRN